MDFDRRFEDQRSGAQQQTRQEASLGGGGEQWDNPSSSGQGKWEYRADQCMFTANITLLCTALVPRSTDRYSLLNFFFP
jgi:hypothetical protein